MRRRKTVADRRAEAEERAFRARRDFFQQLREAKTFAEALYLSSCAPATTAPERPFFSNLGFFLHNLIPPCGASGSELVEYKRILSTATHLTPEQVQKVEEALDAAIEKPRRF